MKQDHYQSTTRGVLLEVGGVVALAAATAVLTNVLRPTFSSFGLVVTGVVLAVVPAVLWLIAFYRSDRLEPEPRRYVIGIFLLGALLAQAVGQPLIRNVFRVQELSGTGLLWEVLGAILIVGLVQEFIKYAAVRYTVFGSAEFDQRVDGIIYGASAGLGYATVLNIQYIVGNGGVDLGVGAIRVAIAALAQASFGGVMGYFLGRAKFDAMGAGWLPLGLLVSAVLNGLVSVLLREITTLGNLSFNPWYGLVAAAVLSGAIFVFLLRTISRLNRVIVATQG